LSVATGDEPVSSPPTFEPKTTLVELAKLVVKALPLTFA